MKIIFLDIDGVLASLDYIRSLSLLKEPNPDSYGYSFDPRCVRNLQYILNCVPDARIVISSSWKSMGVMNLAHMWHIRNLPGDIIGTTPDLLRTTIESSRGMEIQKWLEDEDGIDSYVIIDDDGDMLGSQMERFVRTDPMIGLTTADSMKAVRILNQ